MTQLAALGPEAQGIIALCAGLMLAAGWFIMLVLRQADRYEENRLREEQEEQRNMKLNEAPKRLFGIPKIR